MQSLKPGVFFQSEKFKPFLADECQVNPGVYGAELAWWLAQKLAERGIQTSYPGSEDWGWLIEYINPSGEEFHLCCSNTEASEREWHCFLDPKRPALFGSKPPADHAEPLLTALKQILESEPSISNIRWESV